MILKGRPRGLLVKAAIARQYCPLARGGRSGIAEKEAPWPGSI